MVARQQAARLQLKAGAMNTKMLGTVMQPFCGKCCGEHSKRGSTRQKRQARAKEKRAVAALVNDELN